MPPDIVPPPAARSHPLDAAARGAAFALLGAIRDGRVTVVEGGVRHEFGGGGDGAPAVTLRVDSPHAYLLALRGSVGMARGYVDRLWDCDDPATLVGIVARNLDTLDRWRSRVQPLAAPAIAASGWIRRNTRDRARRRVRAHYDIGNDLFEAMLDETMSYSCAVFPSPEATLAEASVAKMDMVCRKLGLTPAHHLVEIGSGWGGLAVHAASAYGCRVTTTTVSARQHELAVERVRRAGLAGRVRVLLEDYRDLRGTYDRLASVEMIEAVGWQDFDTYFRACTRLLRRDGAMLLQAIVASDRLSRRWRSGTGLANSVLFPGGALPSVEAVLGSTERTTDLRLLSLEDITDHYVPTLRGWRLRFLANRGRLDPVRYGERFARLWEFYLAYCEGAFAERRIRDVQMLLGRPGHRVQPSQPGRPASAPAIGDRGLELRGERAGAVKAAAGALTRQAV